MGKTFCLLFVLLFSTLSFAQGKIMQFDVGVYSGEGVLNKSPIGPMPYDITLTIEASGRITRVQTLKDGTVISDSEWQIVYPNQGQSFHFVDNKGTVVGNGMCGDAQYCRYSFLYDDPSRGGQTLYISEDLVRTGNTWSRMGRVFKPGSGRETLEEWSEVLVKNP